MDLVMKMLVLFIIVMVIAAIVAVVLICNFFTTPRWERNSNGIGESIYYSVTSVLCGLLVFSLSVYCIPWLRVSEYQGDGAVKVSRWWLFENSTRIHDARALPNLVRNSSGRTLELVWIGYGGQSTRRDKLAPGAELRYGREVEEVVTSASFPESLTSASEPAFIILAVEEGSVPADTLTRWQLQVRRREEPLELQNIPDTF